MFTTPLLLLSIVCSSIYAIPTARWRRSDDLKYAPCKNIYPQCAEWKSKHGWCEDAQYKDYMAQVCPAACEFCRVDKHSRSDIEHPENNEDSDTTETHVTDAKDTETEEASGDEEPAKLPSSDNKKTLLEIMHKNGDVKAYAVSRSAKSDKTKKSDKTDKSVKSETQHPAATETESTPVTETKALMVAKPIAANKPAATQVNAAAAATPTVVNNAPAPVPAAVKTAADTQAAVKPTTTSVAKENVEAPPNESDESNESESGSGNANQNEADEEVSGEIPSDEDPDTSDTAPKLNDEITPSATIKLKADQENATEEEEEDEEGDNEEHEEPETRDSSSSKTKKDDKKPADGGKKLASEGKKLASDFLPEELVPATQEERKENEKEEFDSGKKTPQGKLSFVLRQNFNEEFKNAQSTNYQMLAGNIKKDLEKVLQGTSVKDIVFSEATIEGNPRQTGKTRVSFTLNGANQKVMKSLLKLVDEGNINGLAIVKSSLENDDDD